MTTSVLFLNSAKKWGGNEHWTHLAATECAKRGKTMIAGRNAAVLSRFSVPTFELPFLFELDPVTIIWLIGLILKHDIRILIPTKRKDYVIAGLAAVFTGRRNFIRMGIVRKLDSNGFNQLIYDTWTTGIIVNASSIKTGLKQNLSISTRKIHVIYNGIHIEKIRDQASFSTEFSKPDGFTLVTVGECSTRKGQEAVIRALAKIRMPVHYLIIGDGPDRKRFSDLATELGLQGQVHFLGQVDNPHPIVQQSDAMILPSSSEGIANVVLEAMAIGVPVIATSGAGGLTEVFEPDTHFVYLPDRQPESIVHAVERLMNTPDLRLAMVRNAEERLSTVFSLDLMGEELWRVIHQ